MRVTSRHHKRREEWVAVLSYWVRPHVKGPEEAPYVPSTHVVETLEPLEPTL
jgi:hypothetical protein